MNITTWLAQLEQTSGVPLSLLGTELAIVLALLIIARFAHGWSSGVDTQVELAQNDNVAFGISLAGGVAGLCLVLTGLFRLPITTGTTGHIVALSLLGLASLGLIRLGRLLYDKLALNRVDKHKQVLSGNIAMALVDSAVTLSIAYTLRGTLLWLNELSLLALLMLCLNYFITLILLVIVTRVLEAKYRRLNQGDSLQHALEQDHRAVALRHSAYLIACGVVIGATGQFHPYDNMEPVMNIAAWLTWSVLGLTLLMLISWAMRRVVMAHIKVDVEVEHQYNSGVAILDGALVIAAAYLLHQLIPT